MGPCGGLVVQEGEEWGFGLSDEFGLAAFPWKPEAVGVQGVAGEDEARLLLRGEATFNEGKVGVRDEPIQLVPDQGMADVREVDADLVLAAGVGPGLDEGESTLGPEESPNHEPTSQGS